MLVTMLKEKGYETYVVKNNGMFKVQVGAFSVKANAIKVINDLKSKGYNAFLTT